MYKHIPSIYTPYSLFIMHMLILKKKSKLNTFYILHTAWKNLKLPFLPKS